MGPASTIRSRHHARLLATALPRHYLRGGLPVSAGHRKRFEL